jgi:hypothetical protein
MSFRKDPLVGVGIIYLSIKSQTINRIWIVKWMTVIQQPIQKFDIRTLKEYILIISEHEPTDFRPLVHFNFHIE